MLRGANCYSFRKAVPPEIHSFPPSSSPNTICTSHAVCTTLELKYLKVASLYRRNGEVSRLFFSSPANLCVKWLLLSFRVNYELLTNCKGEFLYVFMASTCLNNIISHRAKAHHPSQKPLPKKNNKTNKQTHQLPSKLKLFLLKGCPFGAWRIFGIPRGHNIPFEVGRSRMLQNLGPWGNIGGL